MEHIGKYLDFRMNKLLITALETERINRSWNAKQMAEAIGIAFTHYSEFVHGKRALPLKARAGAFKLGIPAALLLEP